MLATQKVILLGGSAVAAFLLYQQQQNANAASGDPQNVGTAPPDAPSDGSGGVGTCPEGTELRGDGLCWDITATAGSNGGCDVGTTLKEDGLCHDDNEGDGGSDPVPPKIAGGDIFTNLTPVQAFFAQTALGLGTGFLIDTAIDKALDRVTDKADDAALKASKAAKNADEATDAAKAAKGLSKVDDAADAAKGVKTLDSAADAARAAKALKAADDAADAVKSAKAAAKAAKVAAKAAKSAGMIQKLLSSPAGIIVAVISAVLSEVLNLDDEDFKPAEAGYFAIADLPDYLKTMISQIPFLGDLFDLLSGSLSVKSGCATGLEQGAGLGSGFCYQPCSELVGEGTWQNDGANVCYRHYPEWENNGNQALHSILGIQKRIDTDTGLIPDVCPQEHPVKSGALCYDRTDFPSDNVAGVAWEQCNTGERSGFTDTGIRCEKLQTLPAGTIPPVKGCDQFGGGLRDDGTSCWEDWKGLGGGACRGGGCNTWWDGCCSRGAFGECWGCARTHCEPITCDPVYDQGGCGCIKVADWDRRYCPNGEKIDGLCYGGCDPDKSRVAGMPYLCSASFDKRTQVMAPHSAICPPNKKDIAGLCYMGDEELDQRGMIRKTIGLIEQPCPNPSSADVTQGSVDMGIFCLRQSKWRDVKGVPFDIKFRERK
jgi:hypothetical protein